MSFKLIVQDAKLRMILLKAGKGYRWPTKMEITGFKRQVNANLDDWLREQAAVFLANKK